MLTGPFLYKAFISYSHEDERFAARLHRKLEGYRIPRRLRFRLGLSTARLGTIFRDRDELASSTSLTDAIREALQQSEFLVVICSRQAAESQWVNEEVKLFQEMRGRENILIIIDPETPEAYAQECFPAIVRETTDEPLAADARKNADGESRAIRKLIAGLLGVRFDELQQREASRRRIRWLGGATLFIAVISATGLLLLQTQRAEREALDQRNQAAALVGYLVDDLEQRLSEYEELGELDAGLAQALNFFAAADVAELDVVALENYRTALRGVGSVRLRQGELEEALQTFRRAAVIGEALVGRQDDNAKYWFEFAQNSYYIAEALWEMQDVPAAAEQIELALGYARRAVELEPDALEYQLEVIHQLNNFGAVNTRLKRYDAAIDALMAALVLIEQLPHASAEEEVALLHQEAEAISWLTEIMPTTGQFDEAFRWHERELNLRELLLKRTGNLHHSARLADALGYYAKTLSLVGRNAEAVVALERKIEIARQLVQEDAENAFWSIRLPSGQVQLAVAVFHTGDRPRALALLDEAEAGLNDLFSEGKAGQAVDIERRIAEVSRAYFNLDEQPDISRDLAAGVISSLQDEIEKIEVNSLALQEYLAAVILQTTAELALGMPADLDRLSYALNLLAAHGKPESSVYDMAAQAMLLLAVGDSAALPVIERLDSLGLHSMYYLEMIRRLR